MRPCSASGDGGVLSVQAASLNAWRRAQVLSNTIKEKRKQKAGKWSVPIPKVAPIGEEEMFKVIKTGKRKSECHATLTHLPHSRCANATAVALCASSTLTAVRLPAYVCSV